MASLITPAEMRAALDLPDTVTDAELQPIGDSATDLVVRLLFPPTTRETRRSARRS